MNNLTTEFDDLIKDDYGTWSQVCETCQSKLKMKEIKLSIGSIGTCGIIDCENESDYYVDFK